MATRIDERLEKYIERVPFGGCWVWTGALTHGYGVIYFNGSVRRAHRVMYQLIVGAIPSGLELDHLCRNRCCVNPSHLEPVTRSVNIRRGINAEVTQARNAAITHCPNGHEYTPENTYKDKRNRRTCKICARQACKRYYRKLQSSCHEEGARQEEGRRQEEGLSR